MPDSVYKLVASRWSRLWKNKRGVCRSTTGNSHLPTTDLQSKSSVVKRIKCAAGNLLPLSFLCHEIFVRKIVERGCNTITYKIPIEDEV